jgi:hypothetical protein
VSDYSYLTFPKEILVLELSMLLNDLDGIHGYNKSITAYLQYNKVPNIKLQWIVLHVKILYGIFSSKDSCVE